MYVECKVQVSNSSNVIVLLREAFAHWTLDLFYERSHVGHVLANNFNSSHIECFPNTKSDL